MATDFVVRRGNVVFQATYGSPFFGIWKEPASLLEHLHAKLESRGFRLTDAKWDQANNIGDTQLNFYLFEFGVGVRLRVGRVEIENFNITTVSNEDLNGVALDVLAAIQLHDPQLKFTAYSVSAGYHGELQGAESVDFTGQFATAPNGLGNRIGSGAVFYYGPELDRTSSAVTIDLSNVIAGGVYLRFYVSWDGAKTKVDELRQLAEDYFERVFVAFGLNLQHENSK